MKPSWNDCPEWANYLAKDASGMWFWHEEKPYISGQEWVSEGDVAYAGSGISWENSFKERPKQ
jgi:hypothetical protein